MSFFSDLSRKLGFTSGEDDREDELEEDVPEDEEIDDEPEDEEEEDGGARFRNPFRTRSASRSRQQPAQEEEEEEEPPARSAKRGSVIHDPRMESRSAQGQQAPSAYTHREWIYKVQSMEDCRYIIQYLLQGDSVLLNLENVDNKISSRVVDLLSGAAFALQGRLVKVAHLSYLLAPNNVEVSDLAGSPAADRARYSRPVDG